MSNADYALAQTKFLNVHIISKLSEKHTFSSYIKIATPSLILDDEWLFGWKTGNPHNISMKKGLGSTVMQWVSSNKASALKHKITMNASVK